MINTLSSLHPRFITGFTDGEGCFHISITKRKTVKLQWIVILVFKITLHQRDKALLERIKSYFCDVGSIYKNGPQTIEYKVHSIKDLLIIIEHFDKYPLITKKQIDYLLFKQVFNLINEKEHLTIEGLQKIIAIKSSINRGLSDKLKAAFPKIKEVERPSVLNLEIIDPNWLAGFVSGEGSFLIDIYKSKTIIGMGVTLRFYLSQHSRDELLMKSLVSYFGCGHYKPRNNRDFGEFVITKLEDLIEKVIPLFQKYQILGIKHLDFLDFVKVAEIMKEKGHLTERGLDQVIKIKAGMNKGRS